MLGPNNYTATIAVNPRRAGAPSVPPRAGGGGRFYAGLVKLVLVAPDQCNPGLSGPRYPDPHRVPHTNKA